MREAAVYYKQAFAKALAAINEKLESDKKKLNVTEVRLENIAYDADSYISHISELPDEPKAPSPDLLEVKVAVDVTYSIKR